MLSRTNNVCKFVFPHVATTGLPLDSPELHSQEAAKEGGRLPSRCGALSEPGARKCTTVRERNVETVYV